jgi:hypothetical protein
MKTTETRTESSLIDARLVSLKTLAQMLDANRSSIRRWLGGAGIRPVTIGRGRNGSIRYRWRDVRDWLASRQYVD